VEELNRKITEKVIQEIRIKGWTKETFNKKMKKSERWISRIENGKVVEQREDFDMLGLYQQLGMELKPKEAER